MPLQNRVTPFGDIVAVEARGLMMGNRGILHDDQKRIVRSWQVRRWIACVTEFRGRRRSVMQPHRYTELFFLDEATAFAAGHRPCAECRNADYKRFRDLWLACHGGPAGADDMDARIHRERLIGRREKRVHRLSMSDLPDGAFVVVDDCAWLVCGDALLAWSPSGYTRKRERPARGTIDALTPPSIVAVLAAGYRASAHPSAG